MFKKVKVLEQDMKQHLKEGIGSKEDLILRCKVLAEKTRQLMVHSERKVGRRHYKRGFPSSPKLKEIAHEIIALKKVLRYYVTATSNVMLAAV